MSSKPLRHLRTNFSLQRDASSDLSFSLSSDSGEHLASSSPHAASPGNTFQWPSEPLSPDSTSQRKDDDTMGDSSNINKDAVDRISQADHVANTSSTDLHPELSEPRLSSQVTTAMDQLEEQTRRELSLDPKIAATPPSNLNPALNTLQRSFSSSTSKSMASEQGGVTLTNPSFPSMLPSILQNTVLLPLSLLHALIPQQLLEANSPGHEGLSASTMQVPMTSVNALMEACSAIEWIAKASLSLENTDTNSRQIPQQSQGQQQSTDDDSSMAHFDIFELVQKLTDVVSGVAASRGIDLVLDLLPSLHGEPAPNQSHYRLGSCSVWADRAALNFLLMSCLSKIVHVAPIKSTIIISSALMEKDETFLSDASVPNTKLMIFTLGLHIIFPPSFVDTDSVNLALSEVSFTSLLDSFGARLVAERSKKTESGNSDTALAPRHSLQYAISVPVGKLPDFATSAKDQQDEIHNYGPTPEQLSAFIPTLKGKKVALYSASTSTFAHKLDASLTGLGCHVAPVYLDTPAVSLPTNLKRSTHTAVALTSGRPTLVSFDSTLHSRLLASATASLDSPKSSPKGTTAEAADVAVLDPVTGVPVTFRSAPPSSTPTLSSSTQSGQNDVNKMTLQSSAIPFSFVIIDDDIAALQKELLRIRSAVPLLKSALVSSACATSPAVAVLPTSRPSRPPLTHRTKSSPQVERLNAQHSEAHQTRSSDSSPTPRLKSVFEGAEHDSVTQTIIFFTSMKSYRVVRETVQPIIDSASFRGNASPPEIMVLPKPAGIRRILTALYATEKKFVVHPSLQPIATSPLSPLTTHGKSWWAPQSSRMQDDDGFMTLTRNPAMSSETDLDTTPSTPWSPLDSGQTTHITTPYAQLSHAALPSATAQRSPDSHTLAETASVGAQIEQATSTSTVGESPDSSIQPAGVKQGAVNDPIASFMEPDGATSTSRSAHSTSTSQNPVSAEALEYFSETAAKIGGSAASGMVIQSPDGRPAGIFFQPILSRGASTNSIRRGSASGPFERRDSGASAASSAGELAGRDRRLTNRSSSSSTHKRTISDLSSARNISAPSGENEGSSAKTPQIQAGNTQTSYPSGSMFAPQVGIHAVLSGSRPPMATPLSSQSGQLPTLSPSSKAQQQEIVRREPLNSDSQAPDIKAETTETQDSQTLKAPAASTIDTLPSPDPPSSSVAINSASANIPTSKRKLPAKGNTKKADASPVSQSSNTSKKAMEASASTPASRSSARQQPPASNASPADPKSKPSAMPQSGFMIGMGFTSSAQKGRGPRKAPVREAVLPPIKVLIVEDNPINQRILSMFMTKKKIKYDVANNGREAVDKWKTGGYHLILMDIQLPVMDGISATKEIRKLERNANIGILPNTPPATTEANAAEGQTSPQKGDTSAINTLSSQGLTKYPVGGSLISTSPAKPVVASSTSRGALINGVGKDNVRLLKKVSGGGRSGINPFRASVIIVALTASVLSSDRVEALAAGCNDFLNKPVSLPWLNQKILEWGSMMYLMYSGLSSDDLSQVNPDGGGTSAGAGKHDTSLSANKAQLHLGFGYGPAEKAKTLANNLHLGDTLALKKKKKEQQIQAEAQAKASISPPIESPPAQPQSIAGSKATQDAVQATLPTSSTATDSHTSP